MHLIDFVCQCYLLVYCIIGLKNNIANQILQFLYAEHRIRSTILLGLGQPVCYLNAITVM